MKETMATTIKDVAKHAGVSISTVSRVLNNLDKVSDSTRKKVKESVGELNFVPNNFAVSMVKKSSRMIMVVVPDLINPFYMSVVSGVEQTIRHAGYHSLILATDDQSEEELKVFISTAGKFVDGAIVIPASPNNKVYLAFKKPIILVDRYKPEWNMDIVDIDNFGGAYLLMKHLIDFGHKNIGVLTGSMDFNVGLERYSGIIKASQDAGITLDEENIIIGDWYEKTGYNGTKQLLALPNPPSAIIATNNLICTGCIKALYENHISIGDKISLVGFDQNLLNDLLNLKITVIHRPTTEMGIVAAECLLKRIGGFVPNKITIKNTLQVEMIEGTSVKNLSEE